MVIVLEMGLITPPVGLNVFVLKSGTATDRHEGLDLTRKVDGRGVGIENLEPLLQQVRAGRMVHDFINKDILGSCWTQRQQRGACRHRKPLK